MQWYFKNSRMSCEITTAQVVCGSALTSQVSHRLNGDSVCTVTHSIHLTAYIYDHDLSKIYILILNVKNMISIPNDLHCLNVLCLSVVSEINCQPLYVRTPFLMCITLLTSPHLSLLLLSLGFNKYIGQLHRRRNPWPDGQEA